MCGNQENISLTNFRLKRKGKSKRKAAPNTICYSKSVVAAGWEAFHSCYSGSIEQTLRTETPAPLEKQMS